MRIVGTNDVRDWFARAAELSEFTRGIGGTTDPESDQSLGIPDHLQFLIRKLGEHTADGVPVDALDSIPFYSLCRGFFLPLSMMDPDRAAVLFQLKITAPPDTAGREALLSDFLNRHIGLTLSEQIGCVLGDVFFGRRSTVRRDSLVRLLMSLQLMTRRECLDRLAQAGDVAILFAESRPALRSNVPLSSAEVIRTLRYLPDARPTIRFRVLRSLFQRCGKLEAYFLARLLLQKAGLGFDYQGSLIARLLAAKFGAAEEHVSHAMALTDVFRVTEVLLRDGADGLRAIQLQPLVPVRPMLSGGLANDLEPRDLPVWVERKYDGIRLLLHKSTDARGAVLCGAYTRNRGDWLEQISGLEMSIRSLPATNCIVDGELYGTVLDPDAGVRPASVYEVYASLQGQAGIPVNLRFAAFDLLYLNSVDLTQRPLHERRGFLVSLITPLQGRPLPVPLAVSEGQMAGTKDDLNRLFHHFRAQGYEGIITKDLNGVYRLATRDAAWKKRKPEITLDLVLLGAIRAVTTKESAGMFGSYVIGARTAQGGFDIVGDVAGIDRLREQEIQREIMREGLMTGQRMERPSSSGVRPGYALRPHIVVTIRFEGIARDQVTGALSLRDPSLVVIRSDKPSAEADTLATLEELYLRQRIG